MLFQIVNDYQYWRLLSSPFVNAGRCCHRHSLHVEGDKPCVHEYGNVYLLLTEGMPMELGTVVIIIRSLIIIRPPTHSEKPPTHDKHAKLKAPNSKRKKERLMS